MEPETPPDAPAGVAPARTLPAAGPRFAALAVSTSLGVGLLPAAPGTWGSAFAVGIFVLFSPLPGALLILSLLALGALGVWAADVSEAVFERGDDGRIVIDEVVGQLLALAPLAFLAPAFIEGREIPALVTGFVAFRCLDITKPGPVGWAERRFSGGLGVMMDDVVAGGLAALVVTGGLLLLHAVAPGSAG